MRGILIYGVWNSFLDSSTVLYLEITALLLLYQLQYLTFYKLSNETG